MMLCERYVDFIVKSGLIDHWFGKFLARWSITIRAVSFVITVGEFYFILPELNPWKTTVAVALCIAFCILYLYIIHRMIKFTTWKLRNGDGQLIPLYR